MSFTSESILKTFKDTEVADAPKLKHTQYLHYLARRDLLPDFSTTPNLVESVFRAGDGSEKAFYRRAD
ncbi:hypothetical protein R4K94_13925, partial [Pseudomonas aeruginosa]|nr:hypothetical protein [Pseudomonas aeruginosa]